MVTDGPIQTGRLTLEPVAWLQWCPYDLRRATIPQRTVQVGDARFACSVCSSCAKAWRAGNRPQEELLKSPISYKAKQMSQCFVDCRSGDTIPFSDSSGSYQTKSPLVPASGAEVLSPSGHELSFSPLDWSPSHWRWGEVMTLILHSVPLDTSPCIRLHQEDKTMAHGNQ